MNEDRVKDIAEEWVRRRPEVRSVERELTLVGGGCTADIIGRDTSGSLNWVLECKGAGGGINAATQGLGQCFQYVHQLESRRRQSHDVASQVKVALFMPESSEKALRTLTIPAKVEVYTIDDQNEVPRLHRPAETVQPSVVYLPGTPTLGAYVRETQVDDFGKIMEIVHRLSRRRSPEQRVSREAIKREVRRRFTGRQRVVADGYNHLITMSNLGLLSSLNQLTPLGHEYLQFYRQARVKYRKEMIRIFLPLFMNCQDALLRIAYEKQQPPTRIQCSLFEMVDQITATWRGRVKSLEDRRNVGALLRMLEDLGAVERHGANDYGLRHLVHPDFLPV